MERLSSNSRGKNAARNLSPEGGHGKLYIWQRGRAFGFASFALSLQ